jgi:hypothetical protein
MRELTFNGYLESYVPYLAGEDTLALPRLVELLPKEPRLAAPLLLWAAVSGRADRLGRLLRDDRLKQELEVLVSLQSKSQLETALAAESPSLRPEYSKAWRSYVTRRDAAKRDAGLKLEVRKQALALLQEKDVSRYRVARDLDLNDGNLFAFLTQGNTSKLSLERAFGVLDYLKAA